MIHFVTIIREHNYIEDLCMYGYSGLSTHIHLVGSKALFLLAKHVNVPPRLVGRVRSVVPARGLAQLADLFHLFRHELNLLEVLDNAVWRDRLGDDAVAAHLRPGQDDLRGGDGLAQTLRGAVGDLFDLVAVDEQGLSDHVVTKGLLISMCRLLGTLKHTEYAVMRIPFCWQ